MELATPLELFANSWICFYQEALPIFWVVSCVDSLLTIGDRHWRKLAATFEKAKPANSLPFMWYGCLFMWGAYFCMGAYKRDVVAVIKMGAYIHRVLILCGCLFYFGYTLIHMISNWCGILVMFLIHCPFSLLKLKLKVLILTLIISPINTLNVIGIYMPNL